MPASAHTLVKEERICSTLLIDKLFSGGGSHALAAFPLRMVYMPVERDGHEAPPVQILVSVPKRHLRHAVDRNRVKRQIREAYRNNKSLLAEPLAANPSAGLAVAFVWMDGRVHSSAKVERRMRQLLQRLGERGCALRAK